MANSFRLYLLGGFRLQNTDQRIFLYSRKIESLLAFLVLHPEEHAREKIAGLFWGDSTDEQARLSLRVGLNNLRKQLGAEVVIGDRVTVQFNPDFPLWVDVLEFERRAQGETATETDLQAAVDLYTGDLLTDSYDDWVIRCRDTYRELYSDVLLNLIDYNRAKGAYERAIDFARKLLSNNAAHEQAHQHLMVCYAALGDRSTALQQFEVCKRQLRDELGVEPSKETLALYESLRQQNQVASPAARFTNLPRPVTSFVGRAKEIEQIKELLLTTVPSPEADQILGARLLMLIGAGGSGKTRLAIQAASELLTSFDEGVWWIDLSSLESASPVAQAVAKALGVVEKPNEALLVTLSDALRDSRRLLVIDNCEHLVEGCAQLIEWLLAHCPHLQVLATSREPLNLPGEQDLIVPTLALPDLQRPPAYSSALLGYESIKLFVERATGHQSSFRLTAHNTELVIQICHKLGGLPLGIELAAAQIGAFSLTEILSQLSTQLDLASPSSQTRSRHTTLRTAIDWSYNLLDDVEKVFFRRLAVFAGGWTEEQAIVVAGGYPSSETLLAPRNSGEVADSAWLPVTGAKIVRAILASLVSKSLIQVRRGEDQTRYYMFEMIREYARDSLTSAGEAYATQSRHYTFFAHFAEAAQSALQSVEAERWVAQIEHDHDNLRAALRWAIARDRTPESEPGASLRLVGGLWLFWYKNGYTHEGEDWINQALAANAQRTEELSPALQRHRARAYSGLGTMAWIKGDYEQAGSSHRRALEIYRGLDDKRGIAMTINNLSNALIDNERYAEAAQLLNEGLPLARQLVDGLPATLLLVTRGSLDEYLGDYDQAERCYTEALEVSRRQGLLSEQSLAQHNLGDIEIWRGNLEAALTHFTESLTLAQRLDNKLLISGNLVFTALTLYLAGRGAEALAPCQAALKISIDMGYRSRVVECLAVLGLVAEASEETQTATQIFGTTVTQQRRLKFSFLPIMQAPLDSALTRLKTSVSAPEFEADWSKGSQLTLETASRLFGSITLK
jgi:predicted ATPase/DNA-binding SARP family transcriptional activator